MCVCMPVCVTCMHILVLSQLSLRKHGPKPFVLFFLREGLLGRSRYVCFQGAVVSELLCVASFLWWTFLRGPSSVGSLEPAQGNACLWHSRRHRLHVATLGIRAVSLRWVSLLPSRSQYGLFLLGCPHRDV